jgi:hypothetical protein
MPAESENVLAIMKPRQLKKLLGFDMKSLQQKRHIQKLNNLPQTAVNRYRRQHNHYVGQIDGKSMYRTTHCPHLTSNPQGKRCRACFAETQFRDGPSFLQSSGYRVYNQRGKQRLEHVVIAETVLGRRIRKGECVHHVNMMKDDNRHENLVICTTSYNTWLLKRYAELFAKEHFGA